MRKWADGQMGREWAEWANGERAPGAGMPALAVSLFETFAVVPAARRTQ
jgi:hypothetical protein